jgi:precorrin-3B methylase
MKTMNTNDYKAANLSDNLVGQIQSLEEKISQQANKKVVVIAYEQGSEDRL